MGMTITEKILACHSGQSEVKAGQIIDAKIDLILANEITGSLASKRFKDIGIEKVLEPEKIVLIPDHYSPAKDIGSAQLAKDLREFAVANDISNFFEVGRAGIEHSFLPEQGLVVPGELIVGGDSHTCTYGALGAFSTGVGSTDIAIAMATGKLWLRVPESMKFVLKGKPKNIWVNAKDYILEIIRMIGVDGAQYKAMEFTGEAIEALSMSGRFTMTNMVIEAGAKNGIMAVDNKTLDFLKGKSKKEWKIFESDDDAEYSQTITLDVTDLEPLVAFPSLPSNSRPVSQAVGIKLDQVVIGSCTNGSIEDLMVAAKILEGKKIHPNIRTIIVPSTQQVYLEAVKLGLIETFIKAECIISPPTCGACFGGHMGILTQGEVALATTNRNFVGRMGHIESEVYLSNVAVAAASAIEGCIADPKEVAS